LEIKPKTATLETQVDIDSLITELIARKMRQLLGEASTVVFFAYLEKKCGLPRHEIPDKSEAFIDVLRDVLGSSAKIVESLVVKELYSNLGLEYEEREGYRLVDCVRELRELR